MNSVTYFQYIISEFMENVHNVVYDTKMQLFLLLQVLNNYTLLNVKSIYIAQMYLKSFYKAQLYLSQYNHVLVLYSSYFVITLYKIIISLSIIFFFFYNCAFTGNKKVISDCTIFCY